MTLPDPYRDDPAAQRARSRRNWAIAAGLLAFIVIVFIVTLTKIGGNVGARPI